MKEFVQAAGFEPTLPPGLLVSTISAMLAKKIHCYSHELQCTKHLIKTKTKTNTIKSKFKPYVLVGGITPPVHSRARHRLTSC